MSVYNGASSLADTVQNILSQEGVELEFIIIDDGSTDQTGALLDEYAGLDKRLRVFHQENQGLTRALIAGCAMASGRYIARQDCGDISLPGRLSKQAHLLDANPDCAFVSCWTEIVGPQGEHLNISKGSGLANRPTWVLSGATKSGVLDGPSSHPSVMMRASAYHLAGGYRSEFYFGQDWDLWYRLSALGTFCMIQEVLCSCAVSPSSISGSYKSLQEQFAALSRMALAMRLSGNHDTAVLEKAKAIIRSRQSSSEVRNRISQGQYFIGSSLLKNSDKRAIPYLLDAVRRDPLLWRGWLRLVQASFLFIKLRG